MRYDPQARRFQPALGGESAFYAEPSPDGRWLAWVRYPDGTLWRSRPDGSDRLQLTGPPLEAHMPRWSTDGQHIAFLSWSLEDRTLSVRTTSADGATADLVARPEQPNFHFWDSCWLPEGSIVFSHLKDPSFPSPPGLFRFDPGTRRVERWPGAEDLRYPKCSAEGQVLATTDASSLEFKLLPAGHDHWQELGRIPLGYPSWRSDGRSFCGVNFEAASIDCFVLETRRLERLAEMPDLSLAAWIGVPWMGLDALDRPFVSADRSTAAVYVLDWEAP